MGFLDDLLPIRRLLWKSTPIAFGRDLNFDASFTYTIDANGVVTITSTGGGGSVPTGTGIPHIVGGVQNAASSLIVDADVNAAAAIAATKVVQATGTGFSHVTAGALDVASKKVDLTAAADVTVPATANGVVTSSGTVLQQATNVLAGAGFISIGATPAGAGAVRLANATGITSRNAANSADLALLASDASDNAVIGAAAASKVSLTFGGTEKAKIDGAHGLIYAGGSSTDCVAAIGPLVGFESSNAGVWLLPNATPATAANVAMYTTAANVYINSASAGGSVYVLHAASVVKHQWDGTAGAELAGYPRYGMSTAWGSVNGTGTQAMADANQTIAAAVYKYSALLTTGANTANRDVVWPTATDAQSYEVTVHNTCTGAFSTNHKCAAGTAILIGNGKTAKLRIDSTGVRRVTADV